jgi:hypothetical protein
MTESAWMTSDDAHRMLEYALPCATGRKLRLFAVACCRRIVHAFPDQTDAKDRLVMAERYADGLATASEIQGAQHLYLCGGGVSFDRFGHEAAREVPQWAAVSAQLKCEAAARFGLTKPPPRPNLVGRLRRLFIRPTMPLPTDPPPPEYLAELRSQAALLRDIFGNPFRPAAFAPEWRTSTAVALAQQMYESRDFGAMPILADALQDAGCDSGDVLDHCRGPGPHVRGCWVVDLVLGKG